MNPYYNPEAFGLVIIGEVECPKSYEFDQVVVWRDRAGDLWAAHDSGCSCPTPFDGLEYPAGMTRIKQWEDIKPLLDRLSEYEAPKPSAILDLIGKIRNELECSRTSSP